jgi:hypothetical protein
MIKQITDFLEDKISQQDLTDYIDFLPLRERIDIVVYVLDNCTKDDIKSKLKPIMRHYKEILLEMKNTLRDTSSGFDCDLAIKNAYKTLSLRKRGDKITKIFTNI